jgi:hypothetical protein
MWKESPSGHPTQELNNAAESATEGLMRPFAFVALFAVLSGCAGAGEPGGGTTAVAGGGGAGVTGDERGGTIANGLANSNAAYGQATNHCKNYGKKAFITKWDPPNNRGAIVFECK